MAKLLQILLYIQTMHQVQQMLIRLRLAQDTQSKGLMITRLWITDMLKLQLQKLGVQHLKWL
jgi:hypothetical protein